MEWTVQLCLLCVQVCVLTATSLQAPHRGALAEEGIQHNKNTEEVLDELWNQVEAVTDAPFPEVGRCKHRPGGCSPLAPNQSSRTKRQENKQPWTRPGSRGALGPQGPADPNAPPGPPAPLAPPGPPGTPEVDRCKHRAGGCSPLAPNQVFRDKRQTDSKKKRGRKEKPLSRSGAFSLIGSSRTKRQEKKQRTRPGSRGALRPGPPTPPGPPDVLDSLKLKLPS